MARRIRFGRSYLTTDRALGRANPMHTHPDRAYTGATQRLDRHDLIVPDSYAATPFAVRLRNPLLPLYAIFCAVVLLGILLLARLPEEAPPPMALPPTAPPASTAPAYGQYTHGFNQTRIDICIGLCR